MKRLLALLAAVPAILLFRHLRNNRVPYYATWAEYVGADDEGDALPPALRPDPRIAAIYPGRYQPPLTYADGEFVLGDRDCE